MDDITHDAEFRPDMNHYPLKIMEGKEEPTEHHVSDIVAGGKASDELEQQLHDLQQHHHWDLNLPDDVIDEVQDALTTTDSQNRAQLAYALLDNSPYPEVRAAVLNIDEGGHSNTIRAWILGLIFTTIVSALNALFYLRQPYIIIPIYIVQVLVYPIGKAWEKWIPSKEFSFFGIKCNTNPGRFSKKEHVIAVIMANASFGNGPAYATDVIVAQRKFYGQRWGWAFELLLCISNQMLGFGLSGFFSKYLVDPAAMIWPTNLVNTSLFNALHDHSESDPRMASGWKIGRYRLFLWVMLGSFCWYWFPGYIAPFLSIFAWVTWIKPESVVINQLFGGMTGLSLIPMTFDWTQISGFNFSPLIAPWHAIANTLIGMVLWFWIVTPAIHYSGLFNAEYLPIMDSSIRDNTGHRYNVSKIITPEFVLDTQKYESYSPLFLPTAYMVNYGLGFAGIVAVLVHCGLFHGPDIWFRFRHVGREAEDVHSRLMARFKPIPLWWYGTVTLVMLGVGLGLTQGYDTHLTWWAFFLAIFISIVWWLPLAIIYATTNISIGLNLITEFIFGFMQPGRPMGHYMKVPPRVTFAAQMVACFWASFVQIATTNWALGTIKDICTLQQENHYTCPNGRVFFNASVIWGLIGPKHMLSRGQIYFSLVYFWVAGIVFPVALYIGARMFPRSPIRYISAPIIFSGANLMPPATPLNYFSWGIFGFIFNKFIRNHYRGWWMTYNYIVSAGLDIGLTIGTIVIFLTLTLTNTEFPSWWGTRIASGTLDTTGQAIQKIPAPGETFGPSKW
ncbi:Sexual differentiation process protein isp4 [Penicillium malachiteum]|uniref:Sexual differentiation process protein isp4 n=1 Tax=Penicillium malachiteum TaxID=1324776 RepID=UPI0025481423|nr:Sexual differentiation process protein isp4 [Penicillium malachiteum]KAJ5729695.1 Sexual differentiation process protein isp4 [Penicillium malachiteum]